MINNTNTVIHDSFEDNVATLSTYYRKFEKNQVISNFMQGYDYIYVDEKYLHSKNKTITRDGNDFSENGTKRLFKDGDFNFLKNENDEYVKDVIYAIYTHNKSLLEKLVRLKGYDFPRVYDIYIKN